MKCVFVNDRAPRARTTCAYCSRLIGISYLRDLSTKKLYCGRNCYLSGAAPFPVAGLDGLSMLGLQWAGEFQRVFLSGLDNYKQLIIESSPNCGAFPGRVCLTDD